MIKLLTQIDSKLKVACGAADVRRGEGEEGTDGRLQSGGEHSLLTLTIGNTLKTLETLAFVHLNE